MNCQTMAGINLYYFVRIVTLTSLGPTNIYGARLVDI